MFKYLLPAILLINISYAEDKSNFMEDHFLYLSGGLTNNSIDNKLTEGQFSKGALDDKGSFLEAGVGYRFSQSIFSTVSFQKEKLDLIDKKNYLFSLNYQLNDTFLTPYLGAIGGYSDLKWNKPPYDLQDNNNFDSSSFVFGAQVGIEHSLTEKTKIFSSYQFIKSDHKMNILYELNTIEHNNNQNVQVGFKYEF